MAKRLRSCICGRPEPCATHPRRGARGKGHWGGAYQHARAELLARVTPASRCWICLGFAKVGDPWEADHVTEADAGGGLVGNLALAHRSCNRRRGAQYKARKMKTAADRRAEARVAETLELIRGGR